MDGASPLETERVREIIHIMFTAGAFGIKNGCAMLHFDSNGILQAVEPHYTSWRRPKQIK